jgi:probable F420-dependent oxidoreductase
MTTRPFRFGANLVAVGARSELVDKARWIEDLGFDTILIQDHLGMPSPFPLLVAAAEATSRVRLGTFVLNAGFYHPALLARDVATTDLLVDGRLELGLGAGYAQAEYEAAGLEFPSPGKRVDHLTNLVTELRRLLADGHRPQPAQRPAPPLLIAGNGDRMLRLAAEHADIIDVVPSPPGKRPAIGAAGQAALAERIEFVHAGAGERFAEVELSMSVQVLLDAGKPDLSLVRRFNPGLSDDELLQSPSVLHGSEAEIVETLHHYRETHGVTYFCVPERCVADLGKVIERLR